MGEAISDEIKEDRAAKQRSDTAYFGNRLLYNLNLSLTLFYCDNIIIYIKLLEIIKVV